MNAIHSLALTLDRAGSLDTPARQANAVRWRPSMVRSLVATWSERIRFRWKLRQLAEDSPHLIDDIGMTSLLVEEEIAKRFWQR